MWIAIVLKPMADIDTIQFFRTETESDLFGIRESSYVELTPEDDPDHWQKYDPPTVILFKAATGDALDTGKYDHPVAIYQRGKKFRCLPASE